VSQLHWALSAILESHARLYKELVTRLSTIRQFEKPNEKWAIYGDLVSYLRTIEKIQDLPEERFLFPAIAAKAGISSGGPMCMLYFGLHQIAQPLDRVANFIGRHLNPTPESVAPHLKNFYKENSHVCIPTGDHIACAALCDRMEAILKQEPSATALTELENLTSIYHDIRKQNFEKEDNCLLPMTMSLLTEEELAALGAEMAHAQGQAS
jgi:hypothetical protein